MYINQRDAQILLNSLYFFVKWLYMFRTIISPSSGATFNKLHSAIGTCRYVWLLYSIQTYRHVPIAPCNLLNVAPDVANDSPKQVEPVNEKIKTIHKNLWISLDYIHIAI